MESVKAQLKELMNQKQKVEEDIEMACSRLNAPGMPGMDGPLLDKEGFPRADIDVAAVRADRHQVVCLTNDFKSISKRIEELMEQLHSMARESGASQAQAPSSQGVKKPKLHGTDAPSPMKVDRAGQPPQGPLVAFAVVNEVSSDSPADAAGLQPGDQVCRFGSVSAGGGNELQQVAAVLQASENQEVQTVVLRHGAPVTLVLVPRQWSGRGLLGCHLRPLK